MTSSVCMIVTGSNFFASAFLTVFLPPLPPTAASTPKSKTLLLLVASDDSRTCEFLPVYTPPVSPQALGLSQTLTLVPSSFISIVRRRALPSAACQPLLTLGYIWLSLLNGPTVPRFSTLGSRTELNAGVLNPCTCISPRSTKQFTSLSLLNSDYISIFLYSSSICLNISFFMTIVGRLKLTIDSFEGSQVHLICI